MQVLEVTAERGLKIRELPSQDSRVLDAMPHKMVVNRLDDRLWNGNWYKIRAEFSDRYRVDGYSHRKFLATHGVQEPRGASTDETSNAPTEVESTPLARSLYEVIASSLNLREQPTTASNVIMRLSYGTIVMKLEDSSDLDWWKVSTEAGNLLEEGYVAKAFLAPQAPKPAPNTDLSLLLNVQDAIRRVQNFVGNYANELNESLLRTLNDVVAKYDINRTPRRFSHFMAQIAHESAHFTRREENLNYSAEGLRDIFGKYFTTDADAEAFARQPERIANKVYADRIGNGSEASGDGWRYRGRGYIQLTGRENYRNIGSRLGLDLEDNPDQVANDPEIALAVAADYWDSRNINAAADADDVREVTRRINGKFNGIDDRIRLLARAKSIWGG
ncbi:MAG: SH3 domain-containing protein [Pseudomonadota bacterium]